VRARIAAAWAGATLAGGTLAGCGAAPDDNPRPRSTTRGAPASITIDEPVDGQALRGRELEDGGLRLRARVRGRAQPRSTVFLSASCVPVPCTAQAFVRPSGRWSASLDLMTPADGRFVAIDANAQQGIVASGSAVATVELVSASEARSAIRRDATQARQAPPATRSRRRPPALQREALVIGDSLAVGMADALREALPRWDVRVDAKISRPLAEGMRIFGSERQAPAIAAFSLFTNDDPRSTGALESAVRASASRPGGCAIWATIAAPPVKGVDYGAANQLLRTLAIDPDLALSLQIVDWSAAVAKSPSLIARDGVHATAAGYRARARLFAAAIRSCAGGR
jgi:hypothetical protein